MADYAAYISVAHSNTFWFTNSCNNDMMFYSESSNQRIIFGTRSNSAAMFVVDSNYSRHSGDVYIDSNIYLNKAFNFRGIRLLPNIGGTPLNVTSSVSSMTGFSNDVNNGVSLLGNYVRYMYNNTELLRIEGSNTSNAVLTVLHPSAPSIRVGTDTSNLMYEMLKNGWDVEFYNGPSNSVNAIGGTGAYVYKFPLDSTYTFSNTNTWRNEVGSLMITRLRYPFNNTANQTIQGTSLWVNKPYYSPNIFRPNPLCVGRSVDPSNYETAIIEGSTLIQARENSKDLFRLNQTGTCNIFSAYSNTSNVFVVNANGNVGIGTNTPANKLHVVGSRVSIINSGEARYHLYNNGAAAEWIFGQKTSTNHSLIFSRLIGAGEVDMLTLSNNTFIGISNTSPTKPLEIKNTATSLLGLVQTTASAECSMAFSNTNCAYTMGINTNASGGSNFTFCNNVVGSILTLNSNGNVGIGTLTPTNKLDVSAGVIRSYTNNTNGVQLIAQNDSTTTGRAGLQLYSSNAGKNCLIQLDAAGTAIFQNVTNGPFIFYNSSSALFTISNNGNVGIGTTTPSSILALQGSTNTGIFKITNNTGISNDTWWMGFGHNGISTDANDRARIGVNIASTGSGRLFFTTGISGSQTERMRIDENGNVGIGTVSPTAKVFINNPGSTKLRFDNDVTTNRHIVLYDSQATSNEHQFYGISVNNSNSLGIFRFQVENTTNRYGFFVATNSNASTDLMSILGNGNVGIGTTTPIYPLDVNGAANISSNVVGSVDLLTLSNTNAGFSNQVYMHIVNRGGGNGQGIAGIKFSTWTGRSGPANIIQSIDDGNNSANLTFWTALSTSAPLERMRITTSGNVGIGTTNPASKFHVAESNNNNVYMRLSASNVSLHSDICIANGGNEFTTGTLKGDLCVRNFTGCNVMFGIGSGTHIMTLNSNTNVGIGTTTPSNKLDVVGGSVNVRSGNSGNVFTNNQFLLEHNAGGYRHAIKSRHNAGANDNNNAMDFYIWQTSDTQYVVGSKHIMSATSVGLGVNTQYPSFTMDVAGTSRVTSNAQLNQQYFRSYNSYIDSNVSQVQDYFSYSSGNSAGHLHITLTAGEFNNLGSKHYIISGFYDNTQGVWKTCLPISAPGNFWDNDFDLQLNGTTFRVKRSSGTRAGNVALVVKGDFYGSASFNDLTTSTSNYIDSNVQPLLNSARNRTLYSCFARLGVNILPPSYIFDVDGDGRISSNFYVGSSGTGNLGIGTLSPAAKLHIAESNNNFVSMRLSASNIALHSDIGVANSTSDFVPGSLKGDMCIRNATGCNIMFGRSTNVHIMTLSSNNNVGIGTVTPTYKLDVAGNSRIGSNLLIQNSSTTNAAILQFAASNATLSSSIYLDSAGTLNIYNSGGGISQSNISFYTQNTGPTMTLNSNKYVGIGTTTPGNILDVNGITRINGMYVYHLTFTLPNTDTTTRYIYINGLSTTYAIGGKIMFLNYGYGDPGDSGMFEVNFVATWNGSSGRVSVSTPTNLYASGGYNVQVTSALGIATAGVAKIGIKRNDTLYGNYAYSVTMFFSGFGSSVSSITFGT